MSARWHPQWTDPTSAVTPVEERIDHEEAKRKLRVIYARLNHARGKSWPLAEGPFFSDVEWLCDQMTALLTEHSALRKAFQDEVAKMEAEQALREIAERERDKAQDRLALPATEPAQPEEEPRSYGPGEIDEAYRRAESQ